MQLDMFASVPRCAVQSPPEIERKNRIRVCLMAYAYEILAAPIATDAEFDELCTRIRPEMSTGHEVLDEFFRAEFQPFTGQWIHSHPDLPGLAALHGKLQFDNSGTSSHSVPAT